MTFGKVLKREKGRKYGNTKVEYCGIKFDSKREMQRYLVLKDAESNGVISNLELQPKFELIPAIREEYVKHLKTKDKVETRTVQLAITYTADFAYYKGTDYIVEDVKASKMCLSDKYVLKKKMMLALKGIQIKEVYKATDEI